MASTNLNAITLMINERSEAYDKRKVRVEVTYHMVVHVISHIHKCLIEGSNWPLLVTCDSCADTITTFQGNIPLRQ